MQLNKRLLESVLQQVYAAGEHLTTLLYGNSPLDVQIKPDSTPVTNADIKLDQWMQATWASSFPEIPIISEESPIPDFSVRQQWDWLWCIDPIDGTKGLIENTDEYCINVALIHQSRPVLGVIYAPAKQLIYAALKGYGAFMELSGHRTMLQNPVPVHSPRRWITSHVNDSHWLARLASLSNISWQTTYSALKFGYVAQGAAHVYPKVGPTSEWDVAAGQIILEEVGGAVLDFEGNPLQYNARKSLLNPHFIAVSRFDQFNDCLEELEQIRRRV